MAKKSQLLKGILEGCILKIISYEETYGYEITEKLLKFGFEEISEGTIYPLLIRLEKSGLLKATLKNSPLGPKRKYYSLTVQGEDELNEFQVNWGSLQKIVNNIMEG
ncbi:lineage-specific thermal regulator protein [Clostridium acetireducens DSM 10703]|uniref:Lineage-specific thermal regulator protein n=1 Tax=Clostridium acetireducens DSM 10703 TaxID=1121290 RepID=A0A1E8EZU8_9CLOT|nr:PadR family transcriptional regulator [Clostridium acetireducens]OFI06545.1 lineage-specific thermal regulator protein [Clostridium acetireducens DSM 10703]